VTGRCTPRKQLPGAIRWLQRTGAMLALAAALSCGEGLDCCAPPPTGTLLVTTVTTGVNLDADGYRVVALPQVAGRDSVTRWVGLDTTIAWRLEPTTHIVWLTDIQSSCVSTGDNLRSITITVDDTASTTFAVRCSAS
jgi:hypothetical protein